MMMNRHFNYENFALWQAEPWENRSSRIGPLVQDLGTHNRLDGGDYTPPPWEEEEWRRHYSGKTGSIEDPAVNAYWREQGVAYRILDMTEHWMAVLPAAALEDRQTKLPTLMVCLQADYDDYYWAMKTLSRYREYNLAAGREGFILLYVVSNNGPDRYATYVNILQEAAVLFPCDTARLYLDVGAAVDRAGSLGAIPGLALQDKNGKAVQNPDSLVEPFSSLPIRAVNICGNWEYRGSLARDLVMSDKYSTADFDRERLLYSETGKKMMEGIAIEYDYSTVDAPGLQRHWQEMGLRFDCHETRGERWLTLVPLSAGDHRGKSLPVFCVLQEVYCGNEHLAVTALGYFYELAKIAAQGDCILLFFVLEDRDSNDLLMELVDQAAQLYPVDKSRVYVTGHSHDGRFALEFAARHVDRVAAVATLGNFMGLESEKVLGDPHSSVSDERVEMLSGVDLPLINLCGCCEHGGKLPLNVDASTLALRPGQEFGRTLRLDDRIDCWQRRLRGSGCPPKSREEILAAADSPDIVERTLGIPVDRSEVLFADGFRHYIGDIKNNKGRYHLRMVGHENTPHVPTPIMLSLAWSFVRRFARDLETGETIELY